MRAAAGRPAEEWIERARPDRVTCVGRESMRGVVGVYRDMRFDSSQTTSTHSRGTMKRTICVPGRWPWQARRVPRRLRARSRVFPARTRVSAATVQLRHNKPWQHSCPTLGPRTLYEFHKGSQPAKTAVSRSADARKHQWPALKARVVGPRLVPGVSRLHCFPPRADRSPMPAIRSISTAGTAGLGRPPMSGSSSSGVRGTRSNASGGAVK